MYGTRRAISRKILAENTKTPPAEDINFFHQIMEVTLKELYRARRARRNIIRPRTRAIFRSRHKDRLKQAYDYLIQRLQTKRLRMIRKIHMLKQRASQHNRGLPSVERFTIDHPSCICPYCGASMWREESTAPTRKHPQPTFYLCCNGGKVRVAPTREPPQYLKQLMTSRDSTSRHFRENIRSYNGVFCFTSMGGTINHSLNRTGGAPYIFSIGGQIFHRLGSLIPPEGKPPKYAQMFVFDTENEIKHRLNSCPSNVNDLSEQIIKELRDMFDEHNVLVKVFRYARDRLNAADVENVKLKLQANRISDRREYDLPTMDELAILIVDETGDDTYQPDIIVQHLSNEMERVSFSHPSLMALQYPILFPHGEDGWHSSIMLSDTQDPLKCVSQCDFYAYRIQTRLRESTNLLISGKLFQQYVVNAYAMVEAERLDWIKNNQKKLRRHYFNGLVDAFMRGDLDLTHIGQRVILASSHTGSPRYKYENFQDAVAICRTLGYPDLFITFTCNTNWPEVQFMVDLVQQSGIKDPNRADIMARVFKIKLTQLISEIKTKEIFGKPVAFVQAIEFQKRGLPHAHMLAFLSAEDKIYSPSHIDSVISAEIPDVIADPQCYDVVSRLMLHGPCGHLFPNSPCMVTKKCTKHYPKKFNPETTIDEDGFPRYRRRENGRTIEKSGVHLDNRYVVPYNRYLLLRFDAHINVEICNKSRAIKYLFKYINKPPDRTMAVVTGDHNPGNVVAPNTNEIKAFMDCRYLTAGEACWRLFKFELYNNYPSVTRLSYHLPNQQTVYSNANSSIGDLLESELALTSMFLGWMNKNRNCSHARQYTYVEFPQHYTWVVKDKVWRERKKQAAIGRLYYCHHSSGERFYLRMLLHTVRGCTSFEDIKTVHGVQYDTFKETCSAYGFLADDGEWNHCLQEVSLTATSHQIRMLFVRMIMYCQVSDVSSVWRKNWHLLSDDIQALRRQQLNLPDLQMSAGDQQNFCLLEIEKLLRQFGKSLSDFPGLPIPTPDPFVALTNSLLAQELHYDHASLATQFEREIIKLNVEQKVAYDEIMASVQSNQHRLFFIDGYGGTGKTFLWQVISMKLRSEKKVVLCVASSGIAALLMMGGRTAHSRFHIPIDIHSTSTCHIAQDGDLAELLRNTSLIIWDEAPMTHKYCMESLDRTLRDITSVENPDNENLPFGGITVVFGGDFRQTLPIIPKATRTEIVNSSIKRSYLWDGMEVIKLCQNMRLHREGCTSCEANEIQSFSSWIVSIGDGVSSTVYGDAEVSIPLDIMVEQNEDPVADIVQAVYSDMHENYTDPTYFAHRAILAPLHETVSLINDHMLSDFPGEETCYYSSDTIQSDGGQLDMLEAEFPTEFLNSMKIGNFPVHELKLKVGAPVILLRNIDQATGLCNGTRLIIKRLGTWSIEVEVLTGSHAGDRVYLPRIALASEQKSLNFTLIRRQYPVALCFSMTINKSQGQTLHQVGICLKRQVFTHGQLYVALSRVTKKSGLKIISCDEDGHPTSVMNNIVYHEVLN
ncbi:ATP-dependent DNA helicase PIF1 [Linum perenne]